MMTLRTGHILLILCLSYAPGLCLAGVAFVGAAYGPAETDAEDIFTLDSSTYVFLGFQSEYFVSYEVGVSFFTTAPGEDEGQHKADLLTQLNASVLGHLPFGDSSVFLRGGVGGYQYRDHTGDAISRLVPVYGAGLDLGLKPRVTLRLEWLRYDYMEFNGRYFHYDTGRVGFYIYF